MHIHNTFKISSFVAISISAIMSNVAANPSIDGPRADIGTKEASDLGIELRVGNFSSGFMDESSPLFLTIDLTTFDACKVRGVGIDVWSSSGTLVFGSAISSLSGRNYPFRVDRKYLDTTRVAVACDDGPDVLSRVYSFNLGDLVQFP